MYKNNNQLVYSASDLMLYMESPFASWMNRLAAEGLADSIEKDPDDAMLDMLAQKGLAHEAAFLAQLHADGKQVVEIDERTDKSAQEAATLEAMRAGAEVIFQARLSLDAFAGYADFLIRVPGASELGDFHYTVWDTKLARKAKPYFAVQLCCYAEMLAAVQGCIPDELAIVLGKTNDAGVPEIQTLRTYDYFYFYQSLKQRFLAAQSAFDSGAIPDPAESADYGMWSQYATQILEARDDLSFVANITRTQIQRLQAAGIHTLTELANTRVPRILKIDPLVFQRLKGQAAIQLASRGLEIPLFEVAHNPLRAHEGLALLPPPSASDIYFDLEGFPLLEGGLEYLWGVSYQLGDERCFIDWWAHDSAQERAAFEGFIDWAYQRWLDDPAMHIYHYAHYEVTVLRRLMGRYGSREYEVDQLLRNNVLVDLYPIVRKGLFVGEPAYSIKNIEHIYRGGRSTDVASGGESVVVYERWRENPDGDDWQSSPTLASIREYNKDDCDSTLELADWLRAVQRQESIEYLGPEHADTAAQEGPEQSEAVQLAERLLAKAEGEPDDSLIKTLAWSLEFHRREAKPGWWKVFDWLEGTEDDLYDDMECLSGLVRTDKEPYKPTQRARNLCYEYGFDPNQDTKLGIGSSVYVIGSEDQQAKLTDIDRESGTVALQSKDEPPTHVSLCPNNYVNPQPIPNAILEMVTAWDNKELGQTAVTDFLERRRPRLATSTEGPIIASDIEAVDGAIQAALALQNSTLCIQGPPGTGKTYTASHMIVALIDAGFRVGVMSNSHKAVLNLMNQAVDLLDEKNMRAQVIKLGGSSDEPLLENERVSFIKSTGNLSLTEEDRLLGGTAWAFAHENTKGELDYLFIDEAGQVSIANLIGVGQCTRNIVLMGDQMQLGQPIQGSHPGESGKSCLEYLLGDHPTISDELGIFLPVTRRMHPEVCQVVSDMVYESRLVAHESTQLRELVETDDSGQVAKCAGIQFVPVEHAGNTQYSDEEVAAIVDLVQELTTRKIVTEVGTRDVTLDDILFVAPYNAQVRKLQDALPNEAKVGSVDKFQGQEAPIVIISMCASNASESARGIDFIFNRNRLNVALSRAETLVLVVGSPELANTPVSNLDQMAKVNSFCWLLGEQMRQSN